MRVVLLEDDADLAQAVRDHLSGAGHEVEWFGRVADAEARLRRCREAGPTMELLLLDMKLPHDDGLALLRRLREHGARCPVIVLTACDRASDRICGLQAGADDCLVKPFDLDEMLARIDAVSRRSVGAVRRTLKLRTLLFDFDAKIARRGDERIKLTAMEWALLACLARHPGRICSRTEIASTLGSGFGREERLGNSLEVIVSRLRRKLGTRLITTHRGLGYRLEQ